ncbi:MAG: hypothetical protein K8L99_24075 [Anaerolineae bacterium]|nr:hypothetical protein [Anaerolineae bacterium]
MSEATLLQKLRQADDETHVREVAINLLEASRSREAIEAALRALEHADVDDAVRPALRAKFQAYASGKLRDSAGLVRERLVRLLAAIGHPDDLDIFVQGVNTYEAQPVTDVAQNLRAASLAGLAYIDSDLAGVYATKLLSELETTSAFNGEPAMTAINVLSRQGKILPIYQYVLLAGLDAVEAVQYEVLGKAVESLGASFPANLYGELVDLFAPRDRALINMGLITHIVEQRLEALYPALENMITRTRYDELHHFGVVMLAASRDEALITILYRLAQVSPPPRADNFVEALELVPGQKAESIIEFLKSRS